MNSSDKDLFALQRNSTTSTTMNIPFYFFVTGFGCIERVAGCVVNLAILIVIRRHKKLQTPSNILVYSLALADVLGILPTPVEVTSAVLWYTKTNKWKYTCYLETFLGIICWLGNVLGIHLIAWERFLSITFPIWARLTFTVKFMTKLVIIKWAFILAYISFVMAFGNSGLDINTCGWIFLIKNDVYELHLRYILFYTPSIITGLLYIRIFYISMKRSKTAVQGVSSDQPNAMSKQIQQHKERTKKVLIFQTT